MYTIQHCGVFNYISSALKIKKNANFNYSIIYLDAKLILKDHMNYNCIMIMGDVEADMYTIP